MNNVGIIAEYNPFHNGHYYHLSETKKKMKDHRLVVVMSGNFVQRGEPAFYDKWVRAEMAIRNGADLVIELPFIFACNNAEYFAYGAIQILHKLNVISKISFGSESGSIEKLSKLAHIISDESEEFGDLIKNHLSSGVSYPKARFETIQALVGEELANLINEPNNILAVEYLKQLFLLNSHIEAETILRKGDDYHQSATSIRKAMAKQTSDKCHIKKLLPTETLKVLKGSEQKASRDSEQLFNLVMYKILESHVDELSEILSSGEGLEHRLKKAAVKSKSFDDLIKYTISKRYTKTRIKRLLIHTLMSLNRTEFFNLMEGEKFYARVLGFSESGAELLRNIKRNNLSDIPILTNINKEVDREDPIYKILKYDISSTNIYNLCYYNDIYSRSDHVMKPFGVDLITKRVYN